jgi:hypothetical protein
MFYNHMGEIIKIFEKVSSCYKILSFNKQGLFYRETLNLKVVHKNVISRIGIETCHSPFAKLQILT